MLLELVQVAVVFVFVQQDQERREMSMGFVFDSTCCLFGFVDICLWGLEVTGHQSGINSPPQIMFVAFCEICYVSTFPLLILCDMSCLHFHTSLSPCQHTFGLPLFYSILTQYFSLLHFPDIFNCSFFLRDLTVLLFAVTSHL